MSAPSLPRLVGAAVALMAGCVVAGCAPDTTGFPGSFGSVQVADLRTVASGALTIGTDLEHPPEGFMKGGQPSGVDVTLGQALAHRLGLRARIVGDDFDRLLPDLQAHRFDVVISHVTPADPGADGVDLIPFLRNGEGILSRRDGALQATDLVGLCGARVAVQRGTYEAAEMSVNATHTCRGAAPTVTEVRSETDAIGLLRSRQVDAVLSDAVAAEHAASADVDLLVSSAELPAPDNAIAVAGDQPLMRDAVNRAFADLQSDGSWEGILVLTWNLDNRTP